MSIGFLIPRKITNDKTNQYWKEACRCIRLFYPDVPILMIDDNSDTKYTQEEIPFTNCTLISNTDFPGSGELGAYYYFYKLRPFEKAVMIHDSVFFQKYIDFTSVSDIKFLWSFHPRSNFIVSFQDLLPFSKLSHTEMFKFKCTNSWRSCFGVMSVITWDFLHKLEEKTGLLSSVIPQVTTRYKRECIERLFGFFCHLVKPSLLQDLSFFGYILDYCPWGRTLDDYQKGEGKELPVVKVWTGR